jgi:brefeldin A-resistance guanine nucleotide exchange factor 1
MCVHRIIICINQIQQEAVPESLKNILLVMANGGFLIPSSEKGNKSPLWEQTWKRLDRFLPGMYEEIFPVPQQTAALRPAEDSEQDQATNNQVSRENSDQRTTTNR